MAVSDLTRRRPRPPHALFFLVSTGINNNGMERRETTDQLYRFLDCGKTHLLTDTWMQSWKTYLIQTCEFNRPETSRPNMLLPSARHLGHTWREMSFRPFPMALWIHTASNDEQKTKTTNRVRKSPISNMAAMLWHKVVINFDNHPGLHISWKHNYQKYSL